MAETRLQTVTLKVRTPFVPIFLHVGFDGAGAARDVAISASGKFQDTTIGDLLAVIARELTQIVKRGP